MPLALFLMTGLGLTQGIGLLMLIPLLSLAGIGTDATASGSIVENFSAIFESLGLHLSLETILVLYLSLITLFSLMQYQEKLLTANLQHRFVGYLRTRLFKTLAQAEWLYISRCKGSDLTHVLTQAIQQVQIGTFGFLTVLSGIIILAFQVGLAFWVSVPMTAMILGCSLALALLFRPLNRETHNTGKHLLAEMENLFATSGDFISGVKLAKCYGQVDRHVEKFQQHNQRIEISYLKFVRFSGKTTLFYQIGAALMLCVFFYCAFTVVALPLPELMLLIVIFSRFLPKVAALNQNYQHLLGMLPAFESICSWQQKLEKHRERDTDKDVTFPVPRKAIALDQVAFSYDGNEKHYALQNVSVAFPVGQITAITGPSGAGKSTLADLLMGLLTPANGRIVIDNAPLTTTNSAWFRQVAYVPQDAFLFHDTLRANLLWARPDATDAQLWQALSFAEAKTFVHELPQGLETKVGDRGTGLSGGERQRIALARALLREPSLLILDEATAAIDSVNEERILDTLGKLKKRITIIIIAHRLSKPDIVDQWVTVEAGRVLSYEEQALNGERI